ncbi:DUF2065 domain-containing protein [Hyphococcus sp. DH-69]|uniref:DUF2065 domain-containing protein n=1 Tax=Hyphococcus formosus TaxID=3143534 RepID=UPI00398AC430
MITTSSVLTLSLAKAFGIYMIAAGVSGLLDRDRWAAMLNEFRAHKGLTYISGVFVFALGSALVMVHNIWTDPLAIAISIFCWVAAIEGVVLIAMPDPLMKWSASLLRPGAVFGFAVGIIILGALLLLLGFTGRVGIA